ncbi:MAG: FKBP-type peptidyl-prolyl cis-trans isomerase [Gammaproteobacteria bacterium]
MQIRKGVKLIDEKPGEGSPVQRQKYYRLSIRVSLNHGEMIANPSRCLSYSVDGNTMSHENGFFEHRVRIDRENLIAGIFYAVKSMNVGGYRKVAISPHLAYGEKGIPGVIPANAKIIAEIHVLSELNHG